ncbi:putative serine-threonine protein kinase [Aspergillus crustosus]
MPGNPSSCRLDLKQFQDTNGDHPSQTLIFHDDGSLWWIRIVADWPLPKSVKDLGYFKRRSGFQQFFEAIDFARLQLLNNTVTHIALTLSEQTQDSIKIRDGFQTSDNYFMTLAHRMCCTITEDPNKVSYPPLDQCWGLQKFEACHLQKVEEITPTVSIVLIEQHKLAYKSIDRVIYVPGDAEHVIDEIEALSHFRGHPNIAQLVGLVVSANPHRTNPSVDMLPVITGFLVEYYSGGSLEQGIETNKVLDDALLVQWALQIGEALQSLHLSSRIHLDMKPSNIVLDSQKNAILIDISGTGGFGLEWLSPEMEMFIRRNTENIPANASFAERIATDCWAYGKVLSILAIKSDSAGGVERLQSISRRLMEAIPEARISSGHALEELRNNESHGS